MISVMEKPVFETLLAEAAPVRRLEAGAHLFERGDAVERLYLVCEGAVHLCRIGADGGQVILQRAGPGDILAEASVFAGRYHCAAVCETQAGLRSVPMARLRTVLARDPEMAAALLKHMGQALRAARMRAEILSLRTVKARLAAWQEWQGGVLPPRGSWRLLAGELGVSPEALYREMARMKQEGEGDEA